MTKLEFNSAALSGFVQDNEIEEIKPFVETAKDLLVNKKGVSSEMGQWIDLPNDYDKKEFADIKASAEKIRKDSDILVVIGIGGSYLGAKMAIDFLKGSYFNNLPSDKRNAPQIFFAGNSISGSDMSELIEMLDGQDFSINVISKSGTTTEPSIAFRIFRELLVKKYGEKEANQRTYVTTDANRGSLRKEVNENNFKSFVIPDGVGGRYSVLTAVGLLPIAVAGVDLDELMEGANQARTNYQKASFEENEALQYAAYRNVLYRKGYTNEIFENYEPSLRFLSEWLKQLTGETEGKDDKGIYPSSANFSTDLHSLGQYIQQGMRNLMETVINIKNPQADQVVPTKDNNDDGIQYLEGKNLNYINEKARESVVLAHTEGGVPNMLINVHDQTPASLGYLIYFFEYAIAVSGYLNGINPFNQPGVEDYKSNMFALLGKPGYEDLKKKLEGKNK